MLSTLKLTAILCEAPAPYNMIISYGDFACIIVLVIIVDNSATDDKGDDILASVATSNVFAL